MALDIKILSETEIEVFNSPTTSIKQRVITYQAPGLAPRTVWIDSPKLPDIVWSKDNPGKTVPSDIQAKGDALRRAMIEADINKVAKVQGPRSI